jgi:hypothetical protein
MMRHAAAAQGLGASFLDGWMAQAGAGMQAVIIDPFESKQSISDHRPCIF